MTEEHAEESLGSSQALRRSIRTLMVNHAMAYPNSFASHMAAAAVVWLLAGRQGLTVEQREDLVTKAYTYIERLAKAYPDDALVEEARAEILDLMALNTIVKAHATENVPQPGDLPVDEFMAMMEESWNASPEGLPGPDDDT